MDSNQTKLCNACGNPKDTSSTEFFCKECLAAMLEDVEEDEKAEQQEVAVTRCSCTLCDSVLQDSSIITDGICHTCKNEKRITSASKSITNTTINNISQPVNNVQKSKKDYNNENKTNNNNTDDDDYYSVMAIAVKTPTKLVHERIMKACEEGEVIDLLSSYGSKASRKSTTTDSNYCEIIDATTATTPDSKKATTERTMSNFTEKDCMIVNVKSIETRLKEKFDQAAANGDVLSITSNNNNSPLRKAVENTKPYQNQTERSILTSPKRRHLTYDTTQNDDCYQSLDSSSSSPDSLARKVSQDNTIRIPFHHDVSSSFCCSSLPTRTLPPVGTCKDCNESLYGADCWIRCRTCYAKYRNNIMRTSLSSNKNDATTTTTTTTTGNDTTTNNTGICRTCGGMTKENWQDYCSMCYYQSKNKRKRLE